MLSLLFAALFRFVANAGPEWADLWRGAFVTVPLFNVGRLTIGLYLGRSTTTPSFGAAGSLVALLLWICYSAVVTFLGAESTQVSMRRRGRRLQPKHGVALAADETHRRPAG